MFCTTFAGSVKLSKILIPSGPCRLSSVEIEKRKTSSFGYKKSNVPAGALTVIF